MGWSNGYDTTREVRMEESGKDGAQCYLVIACSAGHKALAEVADLHCFHCSYSDSERQRSPAPATAGTSISKPNRAYPIHGVMDFNFVFLFLLNFIEVPKVQSRHFVFLHS